MYGYNNTSCTNNYTTTNDFSTDFFGHPPLLDNLAIPVQADCLMIPSNEYKPEYSATQMMMMMKQEELCNYSGGSSYGSPSSLDRNIYGLQYHQLTQFSGYDDSAPVRKAFSTGDLERNNMAQQHHRSQSPLSNESSIIECMNAKACKCSPQEKKDKIEKYRSKRNLRNFNKKIKYVCRKTLADSRPRIRGRFAKNSDENDKGVHLIDEWNHIAADNEEDEENWISFVDAFSANVIP
ncbi:hypothetical protein ACET3Z_006019 [Daucus carota]